MIYVNPGEEPFLTAEVIESFSMTAPREQIIEPDQGSGSGGPQGNRVLHAQRRRPRNDRGAEPGDRGEVLTVLA